MDKSIYIHITQETAYGVKIYIARLQSGSQIYLNRDLDKVKEYLKTGGYKLQPGY